jgi:thiol-disulfide isomerase/thioredoxin
MEVHMRRIVLPMLILLSVPVVAQSSRTLPGCEASPEIRKTLHDKLEGPTFDKLSFPEQEALRQNVLADLVARYPREIVPKRRLISIAKREEEALHPGSWEVFQAQYRQQAKEHADDPLVLDMAAYALNGTDTPEAIRLLEGAKTEAPQFVWTDLDLAQIYNSGKFADKAKFSEHLTAYWTACPASMEGSAQWMLAKDMALQAKVAAALRPMLEKATDPDELKDYTFLWSLEFRTRPPQEHDAERQQVAGDLKRLEGVEPHPDAEWMSFLIGGYKQSGASDEAIQAMEDRLVQQYPKSEQAEGIVERRWRDAHKAPEDQKDTAAWVAYRKAGRDEMKEWIKDYPDDNYLSRFARLSDEGDDDALSEKEGIAIVDAYLAAAERDDQPGWVWSKDEARAAKADNLTAEAMKDQEKGNKGMTRFLQGKLVEAAMLAKRPDVVVSLKASIDGTPPEDKKDLSGYWLDRARLAVVEKRKQDALTYYQEALQTRATAPSWQQGKLKDDLTDESRALWSEMGGSETAYVVWSKAPGATVADASEGRWEKPTKTLPDFKLADLSGKTWTLTTLKGKTVLINLWATWCGPCNLELPELEKLYEKVKGRSDLQILTFNIDEDEGLVAPFMKKKGYTFPVLPAYSYTVNLLDGYAIPQNWVVDGKGSWQWTQIGYGSSDGWSEEMIAKLDAAKPDAVKPAN